MPSTEDMRRTIARRTDAAPAGSGGMAAREAISRLRTAAGPRDLARRAVQDFDYDYDASVPGEVEADEYGPRAGRIEYAYERGTEPGAYDPTAMRYLTEQAYEDSGMGADPSLGFIRSAYDAAPMVPGLAPSAMKLGADPMSVQGQGPTDEELARMLAQRSGMR